MPTERPLLKHTAHTVATGLFAAGAAVDISKAYLASFYHDLRPSGLWNNPGEMITVVGNHVMRSVTETPPNTFGLAMNLLALFPPLFTVAYLSLATGRAITSGRRAKNS